MNFKKMLLVGICYFSVLIVAGLKLDKECAIPEKAVFPFAVQGLDLSKEEFRSLIQEATDAMYLKGFRYLGDPRDFDHGHLLYSDDLPSNPDAMPPVVALLYHTQENAFDYHLNDPGSRFDYVDPWARNWVQWVDSKKVANAKDYVPKDLDYDYELNHFTIHEFMLDSGLLNLRLSKKYSKQFLFSDATNKDIPYECRGSKSNLITVVLPSGESKTLALLSDKYFWPYYNDYWLKENREVKD